MMNTKRMLMMYLLAAAFEAVISVVWLGRIPAETGNAVFLGYSASRLLLMACMLMAAGVALVCSFFIRRNLLNYSKMEKIFSSTWLWLLFFGLFSAAWTAIFLPTYQLGGWTGYKDRLLPVFWWVFLFSGQSLIFTAIVKKQKFPGYWRKILRTDQGLLKAWGFITILITFGFLAVALFRIGLIPDIVYWNDTNVPLLGFQIIGTITVSIIAMVVLSKLGFFQDQAFPLKLKQRLLSDIVICLLIWAGAAIVWTQVEMPRSYFSPGPYPPNGEMYPFSDAAGYDTAAQFAAIGEGLGTQTYVDKPLYVAFLALIHLVVGSRMQAVIGLQVAVYALLPVALYLLGLKIHGRLAGVIAAGFVIFREVNNIQGTLWILSTNSRVLMSESLVTLILALSVLFFSGWVFSPEKKGLLMAAGGSLGLAGLVRLNPFLLLPVALVAILLVCWKKWRKALVHCVLFLLCFSAAVLPWMIRSWIVDNSFLYFKSTVNGVVLGQRTFYSLNPPAVQSGTEPAPQPAQPVNKTWNRISGVSRYVSAHFMHNMISTTAMFPTSLQLDSLDQTIKTPGSYWDANWTGTLQPGTAIWLGVNLVIISLGLAAGWSRRRWAGLVPAAFFLAYSLATSAARTSGGRYILPADWVGLFYFALGISQLCSWLIFWVNGETHDSMLKPQNIGLSSGFSTRIAIALLGVFLLVGSLPVLLDRVIPNRYASINKTSLAADLENQGLLPFLQITKPELDVFIQSKEAVVYNGRGLYPRFYEMNHGEPDRFSSTRVQPFPRLVMSMIGPQIMTGGVLPLPKSPDVLPNGTDVLAIGCKGDLNDDWLALVVYSTEKHVYLRSPAAEWKCPVPVPVCDDNRNCQ